MRDNTCMANNIKHGHWVHTTRDDKSSIKGYIILPECACSACKKSVNYEKKTCPFCGTIMDEPSTTDKD